MPTVNAPLPVTSKPVSLNALQNNQPVNPKLDSAVPLSEPPAAAGQLQVELSAPAQTISRNNQIAGRKISLRQRWQNCKEKAVAAGLAAKAGVKKIVDTANVIFYPADALADTILPPKKDALGRTLPDNGLRKCAKASIRIASRAALGSKIGGYLGHVGSLVGAGVGFLLGLYNEGVFGAKPERPDAAGAAQKAPAQEIKEGFK